MSLKAKIEAVIYASEEPVTLAQLTGLLGEEGQAELDVLAAQQHSLALEDEQADGDADIEPVEDADALNAETTGSSEIPEPLSDSVILSEDSQSESQPKDPDTINLATTAEPISGDDAPATEEPAASGAKTLAAEQKLAARKLRDYFRSLLDELIADYANGNRGLEIREVAGGFRLGTKAEYHDAVRGFVKSLKPPLKLTLQALETLAVVAYKQPVTAPEVSEIRGVDSAGVLGSLLTRKLVTTAGRKQVIGRPILYKTTKDFLLRFGLKDINELPSIEEFEKMAGELNDAVQEEIPMETHAAHPSASSDEASADAIELEGHNLQPIEPDAPTSEPESIPEAETSSELEPSADVHSSQADGDPEDEAPEDSEA
ncbi:SMC-Scp complex subunit ScpB [Granulicella sp. L46]|uniref:SMC-Scp complex subunit ScpB n=1 Tax=Granulicella sp. L46 TaxID=1641865 RepID=UPI00131E98DB|nr:SMC-Scp complex subunit ScpB [Granulicella sp. L46]